MLSEFRRMSDRLVDATSTGAVLIRVFPSGDYVFEVLRVTVLSGAFDDSFHSHC